MYFTKGIDEVVKSINKVLGFYGSSHALQDKEIQIAYHDFLKKESIFENFNFSNTFYLTNFSGLKEISTQFYQNKYKHFAVNSELLTARMKQEFFSNILIKLKKLHPEIFILSEFLVKIILLNHLASYTNGTTNETIGLSNMDFKDHYNEMDFIELLVHQMSHMILFIDDRVYEHIDSCNKEVMIEVGLKYKLGGTQFPAYLAFHSYLVGIEILCFRDNVGWLNFNGNYHGTTDRIIKVCCKFKDSLLKHLELFSDRGRAIIEESIALLERSNKTNQTLIYKENI